MRFGIFIAAAALAASASTGARADEWCGYASHDDAMIECGYTTAADCATAVGKGGTCFVDPDVALKATRIKPLFAAKFSPRRG
jgi:hypothetical protein